jgi:GNAT superfamily N-acetyltransferase
MLYADKPSDQAMNFVFLSDRPSALPLVASWYFQQWGHRTVGNSIETIARRLQGSLNRDKPPLLVLAVEQDEILGVAELKIREMDAYPQFEFWLGGVFVLPEHRGKGVASGVAKKVAHLAQSFGIKKLYLQTERLDGGLYAKLAWRPIERANSKGGEVLVMEKQLAYNNSLQPTGYAGG